MAKKSATKQPEVAQVWDEEPNTQAVDQPSEDDGATGTEADISPLDDPTDEDLVEVGELIDGSEDDITDLEQQDEDFAAVASDVGGDESSPVAAAVKAALAVAKKKVKEAPMADKMTKADHIRSEIEKRQKSGDSMRPKDIIEALSKKGVTVTPPQVSVMVKKAGGSKPSTPKPEKIRAASAVKKPIPKAAPKVAAPKAAPKASKTPGLDQQQFELLFDAASFVEKCGGMEHAINALTAYDRLTASRA